MSGSTTFKRKRFVFISTSSVLLVLLLLYLQSKALPEKTADRISPSFDHYATFSSMREAQKEIWRLATTVSVDCSDSLKLIEGNGDDYELCASERYGPKKNNCLVYSFGIGQDIAFDEYMHDEFACDVRMFDPTINQKTRELKPNMHFYNLGVSGINKRIGPNGTWDLYTMSEIIRNLGHTERSLDVVKIDVEKYEWGVLRELIESGTINKIRQILVELHTPTHQLPMTIKDYVEACNTLHELKNAGFEIFKYHKNYCCSDFSPLVRIPGWRTTCCYEVFYVNTNFPAARITKL